MHLHGFSVKLRGYSILAMATMYIPGQNKMTTLFACGTLSYN